MTLDELRRNHKADILRIVAQYGVTDIRVFGSVARGEAGPDSDVDLLVRIPDAMHLYQYMAMENALEDNVHRPVQMISDEAVDVLLRDRIFTEARPL